MWDGLKGVFGGLFVSKPAHTTVLTGDLTITSGTPAQLHQLAQQNREIGSLGGIIPYGLGIPIITPPPAEPKLAAYEEDSKPEIETIQEPDGSIVVKGK